LFRKINNIEIKEDPIFILGHWRQGTTWLQQLIGQDSRLIYQNFYEALFPHIFLCFSKILNYLFSKFLPEKRPFDNMKLDVTTPSETEFSFVNMSSYSPSMCFFFPEKINHYRKYAELEDIPIKHREKWIKDLLLLYKKLQLKNPSNQLLIKNPTDTGRIKILLELFPNAKFIHLYRNPYEIFPSSQRMFKFFLNAFSLQKPKFDFDAFLLENYRILYQLYFETIKLIPEGNLIEVSYEELVQDPVCELEEIYHKLSIPGFKESKKNFVNYIESLAGYQVHKYTFTKEDKRRIYSEWKLTIDRYGYEKPY
jgi:hypothetical protein